MVQPFTWILLYSRMNNVKVSRISVYAPGESRDMKSWSVMSPFGASVSYLPHLNTSMFIWTRWCLLLMGHFLCKADADPYRPISLDLILVSVVMLEPRWKSLYVMYTTPMHACVIAHIHDMLYSTRLWLISHLVSACTSAPRNGNAAFLHCY